MKQEHGDESRAYRYWAFISYSHADEAWASWLHRRIEAYSVPRPLVGTAIPNESTVRPRRLFPIFRDRDELASASSLSAQIQDALGQSRNLLVICSPNAARSRWVGEEIKAFKAMGREDRIFCVIVSGEPYASDGPDAGGTECFAEPLRFRVDADGAVTGERTEPLAADAREQGDGKRNALLKVIAAVLSVGSDSLKQREQERRMRRMAVAGAVLLAAILVLSGLTYYAFRQRNAARREARAARAALSAQIATHSQLLRGAFPLKRLLLAVEALNITDRFDEPPGAAAEEALRDALSDAGGLVFGAPGKPLASVEVSANRRWLATAAEDDDVRLWNIQAGPASASVALPASGSPMAFSANSRWLVTSVRGGQPSRLWDLTRPDPRTNPRTLPGAAGPVVFTADNRWLITGGTDRSIRVWDLGKGDAGAPPIILPPETNPTAVVSVSPNSRWLATSSWVREAHSGSTSVPRLWDLTAEHPESTPLELQGHSSSVSSFIFTPDDHWLVTSSAEQDLHTFRRDSTLRVWDLTRPDPSQEPRVLRGHEGSITATAISPDSRWLVTGSEDKTARLWDLSAADPAAGQQILSGHENRIGAVAVSAQARSIVTITGGRGWRDAPGVAGPTARFWENDGSGIPTPTVFTDAGRPVTVVTSSLSPDGRFLLLGTDAAAFVVDLRDRRPDESARVLRGHEGPISAATFTVDDRSAVTAGEDGTARLWPLSAATVSASPTVVRAEDDESFSLSTDGRWLVTIGDDGAPERSDSVAVLRDLTAQSVAAAPIYLAGHTEPLFDAVMSDDQRWVATASSDQTARLWRMGPNGPASPPFTLKGHSSVVDTLVFSRDGRRLATGSFDGTVRLWDLTARDPSVRPVVLDARGTVFKVAIDRENRWLISSGPETTPAMLWDLTASNPAASGRPLRDAGEARLSPDRRWLVTYGSDERRVLSEQLRSVRSQREAQSLQQRISRAPLITSLWDLRAADPMSTRTVLAAAGQPIAFSPDGVRAVTQGLDDVPRLWKLGDQTPLELKGHLKSLAAAAFDRSGRWLVTGSYDQTARLWDLQAPSPTSQVIATHASSVSTVAISHDDRWIFTASSVKGDVHLAGLPGKEDPASPLNLRMANADVWGAAFTDDGRWLITRSHETRTVSVWTLDRRALVKLACRTAGRNLTRAEWDQYFRGQLYRNVCQ